MDISAAKSISFDSYVDLMQKHVSDARRMATVLGQIPVFTRRAERMHNCSTITRGRYCPTCHSWHTTQASLCRDRLCPNCGWSLARRRANALSATIGSMQDVHLFAVVLTVKNCGMPQLSSVVSDMLSAFSRFSKSSAFRRSFIGYARNVEIKVNKKDIHPHIHMLGVSRSSRPIEKHMLSSLWQHALHADYTPVTWIKEAYGADASDAAYECIKYTVKSSEWLRMNPREILSFAEAIHNKKLFSSGGVLKSLSTVDIPDAVSLLCDRCGTRTIDKTLNMNEVAYAEEKTNARETDA